MTHLWNEYLATLPASLREWMRGLLPLLQILLIAIGAVLLQRLLRRVTNRVAERYRLPAEFNFIARRLLTFVVYGSAWLLALERLGVSGAVLWSAFRRGLFCRVERAVQHFLFAADIHHRHIQAE